MALPSVTWPLPPMATLLSRRTETMVVPLYCCKIISANRLTMVTDVSLEPAARRPAYCPRDSAPVSTIQPVHTAGTCTASQSRTRVHPPACNRFCQPSDNAALVLVWTKYRGDNVDAGSCSEYHHHFSRSLVPRWQPICTGTGMTTIPTYT